MPDIFILGSMKCATTTIYDMLSLHEEVHAQRLKEPHYHFYLCHGDEFVGPADKDVISQMFVKTEDDYKKLYSNSKVNIDASAMNILSKDVIDLIDRDNPNAKYIICLRNPIQRAFSAYCHMIRDVRETRSFSEALRDELDGKIDNWLPIWHYAKGGNYVDMINYTRDKFGDRLMLVDFDDFIKNTDKVIKDIQDFIGITPKILSSKISNRSGVSKFPLIQKMLKRDYFLKRVFVNTVPRKYIEKIKQFIESKNIAEKPQLLEEEKALLVEYYRTEKNKTVNSIDRTFVENIYRGV